MVVVLPEEEECNLIADFGLLISDLCQQSAIVNPQSEIKLRVTSSKFLYKWQDILAQKQE
jgi:hypothetical protein